MSPDLDLGGLLHGRVRMLEGEGASESDPQQRVYGVTLAEVTDLDDPKGLGRVKVKFPWLSEQVDSAWARIATAWAGGSRGTYLLPETGDEVVVAFRHGSLQYPYIIGFVWSDTERPPQFTPRLDKRELRSKSGHRVVFDDLIANEALTLESQGGHTIVLDDSVASTQIKIQDSTGMLSIVIDTQSHKIAISSTAGTIEVSAPGGALKLDATAIDVHATGALNLSADGSVAIRGAIVRIN
jgi:uncharacterized protein involved in type VI secretion and phage assembly